MSTKGSNTVSRHHGETLPTLHVRGKVNGASWGSDCFSVTFSPISFREHVLGCQVLVKPTEPCLFGMLFQFWSFWLHITFSTELNNSASSKTFAKEEAIKVTENLKGISTFGGLACYCLSRHVLTLPTLSSNGISIGMSTQLWLVIRFSFRNTWVTCRFQLLSIKRLCAWSKSQGVIELTIAH